MSMEGKGSIREQGSIRKQGLAREQCLAREQVRPIRCKEMIHYLINKVGVVDFANAQGPEGPAGFEILPIRGLL